MASSVVIIEERTGKQRQITLTGGALPLQGANWSSRQALSTQWNPGNPEATQHVLGPQEVPSLWDFEWKTTVINRNPVSFRNETGSDISIATAHELATVFDDFVRGGALLKVSWISNAQTNSVFESPRQVRIGRMEAVDLNYDRPDDIRGTVAFEWIGRGEDQPKVSAVVGSDIGSVIQDAINSSNAASAAVADDIIRRAARDNPNSATTFTLGQLEAIANGPRELMDSFSRAAISLSNRAIRIAELIETVRETPAAILGRAVDIANIGVTTANEFQDRLTREGPETQATRRKLSNLTNNSTYFSNAQTEADLMAGFYEALAEAARRRQISTVPSAGLSRRQDQTRNDDNFKIHLPRQGETMLSIAQKYYNDPDLGDELAVANGLPAYTITPPRVPIIIPTRRNLDTQNRNRV